MKVFARERGMTARARGASSHWSEDCSGGSGSERQGYGAAIRVEWEARSRSNARAPLQASATKPSARRSSQALSISPLQSTTILLRPRSVERRCPRRFSIGPRMRRVHTLPSAILIAVAVVLAGCATAPFGPSAPPAGAQPTAPVPRNVEPPPPSVNLSGFPLPYRQGYADGCASVSGSEKKDATRFASDPNYRTGWQDGLALCRKK